MNNNKSRGQALVPVLLVMMILTTLAVALAASAHREARASANSAARVQRYYAARGALAYAISSLEQSSNNGAVYGVVTPNSGADSGGWWQIDNAWVKVTAVDSASRVDLNTVTLTSLEQMPIFSENPQLAQAIIDWRTAQSTSSPSSSGSTANSASASAAAENSYYQGLPMPYSIKGAHYDTTDELLLVEGMTPTLLYSTPVGTPAPPADISSSSSNQSAADNPATSRQAAGAGAGSGSPGGQAQTPGGAGQNASGSSSDFTSIFSASSLPLEQLFTSLTREWNVAADGTPRININKATAAQMEQQLGLQASLANSVVQYRTGQSGGSTASGGGTHPGGGKPSAGGSKPPNAGGKPAKPPAAAHKQAGRPGQTPAQPVAANGASTGKPGGSGTSGGGQTAGNTFTSAADLLKISGFDTAELAKIADKIAINDNPYREGVVNINTAPQEALAMVSGMDANMLQAILQYRQNGQTFQTIDDLYSLPGITQQELENTAASLCAKSNIYIVHILVRLPGSARVYAVSASIEIGAIGQQTLQWHEVQRAPGWTNWMVQPALPPATITQTNGSQPGGGQ